MAAGIDWFRWHHGSVSDPKFRLVAKRAGAKVAEVVAMWACMLESASAADDRGNVGIQDFEAIDLMLDMDDGTAERIYGHMCERHLIDLETRRVVAWESRQPKRERPEDNSADRMRALRAKQAQPLTRDATENHVTPCDANGNQETPRVEESRVEESRGETTTSKATDASHQTPLAGANGHPATSKFPNCPQQRIVALYGETIPEAIQPRKWDGADSVALTARWRETCKRLDFSDEAQGVEWFGTFFKVISESDFLMGRTQSVGRAPFRLRLPWVLKKANFDKIVDGMYS